MLKMIEKEKKIVWAHSLIESVHSHLASILGPVMSQFIIVRYRLKEATSYGDQEP